MATIPRTYLTTSKTGLADIPPRNGQVISVWDSDEVWYDAPANGQRDGQPIRRKISGVRVVSELPTNPMEGIAYVYVGYHGTLPESDDPIYDIRVWDNEEWKVVGNNWEDAFVESDVLEDGTFYLTGSLSDTNTKGSLRKSASVYVKDAELYATLRGNADTATDAVNAQNAGLAQRAVNDNASTPKPITGYLNSVSSDATTNIGTHLTFVKGDGTSVIIDVQDTTYNVYTASTDGLVPSTATTTQIDTSGLILSGDGWISTGDITIPAANSATNDGLNQNIANTYIKTLAYDTTTDLLTITQGNDSTTTISIPNTEYSVFSVNGDGLVPAPTAAETSMFLKGDGTWQQVIQSSDIYQGATSVADGVAGLVPAALTGETGKYLRGDGTWGGSFIPGDMGLVPAPAQDFSDNDNFLKGDGTWALPTDTQNTAGSEEDTSHKLYVVGAQTQSNSGEGVATYSNSNVYIQSNKLFSNNIEVVNLSDQQALTNKTYEGYTLGSACASTLAVSVASNDNVPTNNAVISYVASAVPGIIGTALNDVICAPAIAPLYDNTQTYAVGDFCTSGASGDNLLYRCITAVSSPEDFDSNKWVSMTVIEAIKYLIANP